MKQFLIAADQLANTIAGGYADETLSSRCWRGGRRRAVAVIDALFFWQRDHCKSSYEAERMRLQLPRSCERSGKSNPRCAGITTVLRLPGPTKRNFLA